MVSKEELIDIIETLHCETDLLEEMRFGDKFSVGNGHIKIEYSYAYANLGMKLQKEFEDLGYTVKQGAYNSLKVYYTNPNNYLKIFNRWK